MLTNSRLSSLNIRQITSNFIFIIDKYLQDNKDSISLVKMSIICYVDYEVMVVEYQKAYLFLFNQLTDLMARHAELEPEIIEMQQQAEEIIISEAE